MNRCYRVHISPNLPHLCLQECFVFKEVQLHGSKKPAVVYCPIVFSLQCYGDSMNLVGALLHVSGLWGTKVNSGRIQRSHFALRTIEAPFGRTVDYREKFLFLFFLFALQWSLFGCFTLYRCVCTWSPGVRAYFSGATMLFNFCPGQPCCCFYLSSSDKMTDRITFCFPPNSVHIGSF